MTMEIPMEVAGLGDIWDMSGERMGQRKPSIPTFDSNCDKEHAD